MGRRWGWDRWEREFLGWVLVFLCRKQKLFAVVENVLKKGEGGLHRLEGKVASTAVLKRLNPESLIFDFKKIGIQNNNSVVDIRKNLATNMLIIHKLEVLNPLIMHIKQVISERMVVMP